MRLRSATVGRVEPHAAPGRPAGPRASDADRQAAVQRLQRAVAEGRLDLPEFDDRARRAYAAVVMAELAALVADLPPEPDPAVELVGTRTPEAVTSVFGDIRLAGAGGAPQRVTAVFGEVRIDLRGLRTDSERVEIVVGTVFGDIDVIVDEGVDAELRGWTVLGSRTTRLAAVPRVAGSPRIVVHARAVFGDLRLRSLAPGEPVSRWRALVDRLAPPPPPPIPPIWPPTPPKR